MTRPTSLREVIDEFTATVGVNYFHGKWVGCERFEIIFQEKGQMRVNEKEKHSESKCWIIQSFRAMMPSLATEIKYRPGSHTPRGVCFWACVTLWCYPFTLLTGRSNFRKV